jgi:AcrR family transcriptional regulator
MKKQDRILLTVEEEAPAPHRAFGNPIDSKQRLRLVVDAAAKRFELQGFHGTSLQHIADDVGITKAALYHYLDSKEQLLFLIHDAFISTMLDSAEKFIAEHDDPVEQLSFYVTDILTTVANYRPYVKAFFRDYGVLEGDLQAELREKRTHYEHLVETTIRTGIEQGTFASTLDPHHAALFLFGACNWSFQWFRSEKDDVEVLSEQWIQMLMRGFGPAVATT